ncbi:MAG TPA: isopentenyl-diphosphate Delta-isomerase, partial [Longimicrobiales bacterium]|nr:isopentenyl-diphosphate Delta-isomerase [Longimicrobiales bacterium]
GGRPTGLRGGVRQGGSLMSEPERVVLVDERDVPRGASEKLRAHRDGELHRAFSVLVFDGRGRLLLQKRAAGKYHSGGLWSNTCCGHPRPGEPTVDAARRRLREEMDIDTTLRPLLTFRYRADVGGGLTENEYDHVLVGRYDAEPRPDPAEAEAWRWSALSGLRGEVGRDPDRFTRWLRILLDRLPPDDAVLSELPDPAGSPGTAPAARRPGASGR